VTSVHRQLISRDWSDFIDPVGRKGRFVEQNVSQYGSFASAASLFAHSRMNITFALLAWRGFEAISLLMCDVYVQCDQKFEKNRPIFGNVAKTIAKLQKLKNSCIKMLLNVKISTTNCVLKQLI
jgi:hypothetical protein